MRLRPLLAAGGLAAVIFTAVLAGSDGQASAQSTLTVEVGDEWFCATGDTACHVTDGGDVDVETTVQVGDSVQWRWVGFSSHTATECAGNLDTCPTPHLFDSGFKSTGSFSFTFNSPGTYLYRCQAHPTTMRGQVTVLQPTPTPTPTPQPTPTPSPAGPTPTPTPTPASPTPVVLAAVPSAGGEPPGSNGRPAAWWLALAAGGVLSLAGAALLAVRSRRRP